MAFKVTYTDAEGAQTREFRSISGARAHITRDVLKLANALLDDDSLWAGRTQRLIRGRVDALLKGAHDMLLYDGTMAVELEDRAWRIEQVGELAPAGQRPSRGSNGGNGGKGRGEPRWLLAVRYANSCATCKTPIAEGERAYYAPPALFCVSCSPVPWPA